MFQIMFLTERKKKTRLSSLGLIKNDVKSATISRSFEITCLMCLPVAYFNLFIFKRIPMIFCGNLK